MRILSSVPPREEYRFGLLAGGAVVREARAVMKATASIWRLPTAAAADATLVVSELVTNAQRACPAERLGLLLRVDNRDEPAALRIGVWDPDETIPSMPEADLLSEAGRGLFIVASLARCHGVIKPKCGGKIIWAQLAVRTE